MNLLGRSNTGGYIIEFTHDEHEALRRLTDALGESPSFLTDRISNTDLAPTFRAIKLYATHLSAARTLFEMSKDIFEKFNETEARI